MNHVNDAETIREVPGMYVGDIHDGTGIEHMVWELVANAIDQHLAGRCRCIDVSLERDGSIVVDDDGPGIPLVDAAGRPFAEVALTSFHVTPTFDGHAPHEHVGAGRGVGMFPVNALSSRLVLEVFRDGLHRTQRFGRGYAVGPLEEVGPSTRTGTRVTFLPDPLIFADCWVNAGAISARLRELSCLLPALTLTFRDRREHRFHEPRGLLAFLSRTRGGQTAIGGTLVVDRLVGETRVEAAVEWLPTQWPRVSSFANIERTTSDGTHVEGLVEGLAGALRDAVGTPEKLTTKRATEAVRRGLNAVVCVRLNDPTYGNPTKSRLTTPAVRRTVSAVLREAFTVFLRENPALLEHLAAAARK